MRIAIPTCDKKGLKDEVAEHFGRCATYTLVDEKGKLIEIIENTSEHMGGVGLPPELLKNNKVDILLCHELGPRAIELCKSLDIDVYVAKEETVKDIFAAWKEKKIKKANSFNACQEHTL